MTADRFRELRRLFDVALNQPPAERAAWVAAVCPDDPELRNRLETLLAADAADTPTRPLVLVRAGATGASGLEGRRVGEYVLGREIGRGGMGVVYLAARADGLYSRKVAVKIVRADQATADDLRRFHQEREIVSRLDHPDIARLLDGGTTGDGLHYSVIEYVEGLRIDRYCASRASSVDDRIALVRTVCAAVHYAHQHLVVHRDIKPSNILVTADGHAKLLDFGIAKLLDTGDETVNAAGRLMTMTYASPEQLRGDRVSTQSDVYSLGVVLYELLTGCRPHAVDGATPYEIARAVLENDPPPPSVAARVGAGLRRPDAEIDAIVMTALRKEPERRYASADALSEDLRRYLAGLPVAAQPDGLAYRMRKFVARHRSAVTVTAAAVALLVLSALIAVSQARIARGAELRAEREAAAAVLQSRRAEEETRVAERYRQQAEREATTAREQLAIAEQQRAEAERRRVEAAVAGLRAERRANDLRAVSEAMLALGASMPVLPGGNDAARRAADAVREGLLALRAETPADAALARDVAKAQAFLQRDEAARANLTPGVPRGWTFQATDHAAFDVGVDRSDARGAAAYVRGAGAGAGRGSLLQALLPVDAYAGKRLRVSAELKSFGVVQFAGLTFVIVTDWPVPFGVVRRDLRGTTDWTRVSVVFDVPADAATVAIGVALVGSGMVWADDFAIDVVDDTVEPTLLVAPQPTALDFER